LQLSTPNFASFEEKTRREVIRIEEECIGWVHEERRRRNERRAGNESSPQPFPLVRDMVKGTKLEEREERKNEGENEGGTRGERKMKACQ
jgi:hypothetical protein